MGRRSVYGHGDMGKTMTRRFRALAWTGITLALLGSAEAQSLKFRISASNDAAGPGQLTTFLLTFTNTGSSDLVDVAAKVTMPPSVDNVTAPPGMACYYGTYCIKNEVGTLTIGNLPAGSSRAILLNVRLAANSVEGLAPLVATATATGQSDVKDSLPLSIDPTPLLRLGLSQQSGPAIPGKPFTYTVSVGNAGSVTPTAAVVKFPLPTGTSFVSASGGGTQDGGTVTWTLGSLGIGAGRQFRVTVTVDNDLAAGTLVWARAEADPGLATEYIVHSSLASPVAAESPLHIEYSVSQNVVEPGGTVTYSMTATNSGSTDLLDVKAKVLVPGNVGNVTSPPGWKCYYGTYCVAYEIADWTIANLPAGKSVTAFFRTTAAAGAPAGELLRSLFVAAADGAGEISGGLDLQVDPTPLLRLSLVPGSGPAIPGANFTYDLALGNIGTASPTASVLKLQLPPGTSFVSATGGGSHADGVVTWNIGSLGIGLGKRMEATVKVAEDLHQGKLLIALAEADPAIATEYAVRSQAATLVGANQPLQVRYAVSQDAVEKSGELTYTFTASNTGTTELLDISARVLLPEDISNATIPEGWSCYYGTYCIANEIAKWSIASLAPGKSATAFFRIAASGAAVSGDVIRSLLVASSTATGEITAGQDVQIDPSPLLRLSLVPESGPAIPGEEFAYTLSVGNIGTAAPTAVGVSMPLPPGTTLVSASDGGTDSAGLVKWSLGSLGVGAGKRLGLKVKLPAGMAKGSLLAARAEVDPGIATEYKVRSSATSLIGESVPLRVEYALSQDAVEPGGLVNYVVTATNTGATDLLDVTAKVLLPGDIGNVTAPQDWKCYYGTYCVTNEIAKWTIASLPAGKSATSFYRATVATGASPGEVTRSFAISKSTGTGEVTAHKDMHVDPTPLLRLGLIAENGPAEPGKTFTYTLTYGNIGTASPTATVLSMPIPAGTHVDSVFGGSIDSAKGSAIWNIGALAAGFVGQVHLRVSVDSGLAQGSVLMARAEIHSGLAAEYIIGSESVVPVASAVPLQLTYASNKVSVEAGGAATFTLRAKNRGATPLTDLAVKFQLPSGIANVTAPAGVACYYGTYCVASEIASWTLPTLAAGDSASLTLPITVSAGAHAGEILRSMAVGGAGGSSEALEYLDLAIGKQATVALDGNGKVAALPLSAAYQFSRSGKPGFRISLPEGGAITLLVYDLRGKLEETVFQGRLPPGVSFLPLRAGAAGGLRCYRLRTEAGTLSGRFLRASGG
jgi:uncharacterized repeat protein (TIGR01451 family)